MLTGFDWLRRSRNGQELLATLIALAEKPALFATAGEIGPPPAALQSPCARCWIHPQVGGTRSCRLCGEILERSRGLSGLARAAVVIWGWVNRVPQTLRPGAQVPPPHQRDQQQGRTFEVSEFVGLLQMAEVFRLLLHPHEQQELLALLTRDDGDGAAFYWGRFLGLLDPRARDMLVAWGIRTWPQTRIRLLDELRKYVDVDVSRAH